MIDTHPRRRGVTLTEILVVVGVIAFLAGVLLVALAAVKGGGEMTQSMSRMRQIGLWLQTYASDNREHIVPSRFDYSANPYTGQVRSGPVATGNQHEGTWTDILWAVNEVGVFPDQADPTAPDYRFDSPDAALYAKLGAWDGNPLRSGASNTTEVVNGSGPRPFGNGAQEAGEPGYFAANDFFNARPDAAGAPPAGRWYVTGQIKAPDRSLYLVDSFAGEVIGGAEETVDGSNVGGALDFDHSGPGAPGVVDFRYNDVCLMLFLDGHTSPEVAWEDLADLQGNRRIKVESLEQN